MSNLLKDFLKNKKVVFYGDSITHNWEKYDHDYNLTQGENHEYGLGYGHVKMLNDACNFKKVDNFAVSGGCYANCMDINPMRANFRHFGYQVMNSLEVLKEAEVVFVMFGSNDYSEQVPFGDFTDVATCEKQSNMTFYGGMNHGFNKIKEVNPNAKIFVINVLNRTCPVEANRTFNFSVSEYNLAIAHACRIHNIQLIDVSKLFVLPDNFPGGNKTTYTDDGLHPNHEGYIALTDYILNQEVC